jgi:uncharacterized protein
MTTKRRLKIAIIGTGISGLGAASLLHPHHDITVFEKNSYIGGHSRTVDVNDPDGKVPVDTGFIVFNYRNYPLLSKLFAHLNVPVAKSNMSFGASIKGGWLEYGTQRQLNIFAQKRNLLRPAFWGMIRDILKFNKNAKEYLHKDSNITLGQSLDDMRLGRWFREYFILPMGGAIWSSSLSQMLEFPAASFIRFFDNHGLLTLNDHPQWYTVVGGSREYVARIIQPFKDRIRLNAGVHSIERTEKGVSIIDVNGNTEMFDQVICACHADQTLAVLKNPSNDEKRILGSFNYQNNHTVLHSDTSFMPKRKSAWASWVYLSETQKDNSSCVSLSYWMNLLQPIATKMQLFVTLNPGRKPPKHLIYDETTFEHPLFNNAAICAQADIGTIQGKDRLWFCGAYQRYGFHEDGLASAVAMVKHMGIEPPWM